MRLRVAFVAASLSACALVSGLSEYTIEGTSPLAEAGRDGRSDGDSSPPAPTTTTTPPPPDAGPDACPAPVGRPAEITGVRVAPGTIIVDGRPDEWPCTMRVALDQATSAGSIGTIDTHAELTTAWSEDGLRVLVRAGTGAPPAGVSETKPFLNDAVELFVGGAPADGGAFTASDLQIIVDHANRISFFRAGASFDGGDLNVSSATTSTDGGFVVEVFIPAAAIGRATLSPGGYPFDIQIDQHTEAGVQATHWLYARTDASTPGSVCPTYQAPYCNTATWGTLRLLP